MDLERIDYKHDRNNFILEILKEFDNLDPSALDTIFEYKSEDAKNWKDDFREERKA